MRFFHSFLFVAVSQADLRYTMGVIMGFVSEFIIGGFIAIYAGYVIIKKVKGMKAGKFCDCGCGDCSSKGKCGIK